MFNVPLTICGVGRERFEVGEVMICGGCGGRYAVGGVGSLAKEAKENLGELPGAKREERGGKGETLKEV